MKELERPAVMLDTKEKLTKATPLEVAELFTYGLQKKCLFFLTLQEIDL